MVIGGWFWTLGKELLQAEILLDASDTPRKKKGFKINRVFPVSMAFRSTSKEKGDYSVPASGSSMPIKGATTVGASHVVS